MLRLSPLVLLVFFLSSLLPSSFSLRVIGNVQTSDSFYYIGKFAFASHGGNVSSVTVNNRGSGSGSQYIVLYPDTKGSWDSIYDSEYLNCQQKVSLGQKIDVGLNFDIGVYGNRPHFWYAVLAHCDKNLTDNYSGIHVDYNIHFTNGGSVWANEVSWDKQNIAEMSIAFILFYLITLPFILHACVKTRHTGEYRMFLSLGFVIGCQIIYQIFTLAYHAQGMNTGTYNEQIEQTAWWFNTIAVIGLLTLITMSAAGWPAAAANSPMPAKISIGFIFLYLSLYIASFAVNVEFGVSDPSRTVYEFNHWPGYLLCVARVLQVLVILGFVNSTIARNPESKTIYIRFAVFASIWLCSFPLITLAASITESWWRAKAVFGLSNIVMAVAIAAQYFIFHPYQTTTRTFKQMPDEPHHVVDMATERELSVSEVKIHTNENETEMATHANSNSSPRAPRVTGQVAPV